MKKVKKNKSQSLNKNVSQRKKILLVEDDLAIIDIYETIMKRAGFDVEVVNLGEEAINIIKYIGSGEHAKPNIILLDLILPDINGVEVLESIRKNKATKDIMVFILTNQEKTQLPEFSDFKPDKIIIKADTSPSLLLEIIKEQLT